MNSPMNCRACGQVLTPGAGQCPRCGTAVNPFAEQPVGPGMGNPYLPPGAPPYPYPAPSDAGLKYIVPVGVSPLAIISFYCGFFALFCMGFTSPIALLTGILALKQIARNPQMDGKPRAIIGIVLGALGTVGLLVFLGAMLVSLAV